MDTLNNAIADYDKEISRLEQGREITISRKKHVGTTCSMEIFVKKS